ncbi:MAG: hypothetical protein K2Y05_00500 [Hyphomicrobiaceae bacterium]|nr:hypothetical protein [Hyphomicrobiaceae bacterium]
MIAMLTGRDRLVEAKTFEQLHRFRHEIFVGQRRWTVPSRNGLDIDQYDAAEALYFFDRSVAGRIVSHLRLTPTNKLSLLADYFPHLVAPNYELRGDSIFEATRFIALPRDGGMRNKRRLEAELFAAMVNWCMSNRITHVQAILEDTLLPTFLEMAPQTYPLGLPGPYAGGPETIGGGVCIAVRCPMNKQTLADILLYGDADREKSAFIAA